MVKQLAQGHQLVNDRARTQTQTLWPQSLCFDHSTMLSQGRLNPALSAAEQTTFPHPRSQRCTPRPLQHRLTMTGPRAIVARVPLWKSKGLYAMVPPDSEKILSVDYV